MGEAHFFCNYYPGLLLSDSLVQKVENIISPSLDSMGYAVVRVKVIENKGGSILQIMAEPKSEAMGMGIEDCEKISHAVSALLEVEDPISGAYRLEVSSPGLDRPLVKLSDFERYKGFEAKLETSLPIEGQRRFKGAIKKVENEVVTLECDGLDKDIPYRDVSSAKLVLTDELVRHYMKKQKH